MTEISFFVPGLPRPGGSKRVFPIRKAGVLTGKFIVTDAAGQKNKDWRASVAHFATEAFVGNPWTGALHLELQFRIPRPKGHFKSDGVNLRPSAPLFPTSRPDVGKLARSTQDALTHIIWVDDAQIVQERHNKVYSSQPGCLITVREAP